MRKLFLIPVFLFCISLYAYPYNNGHVRITILADGRSAATDKITAVYEDEIKKLTKGSYSVTFANVYGDWNSGKTKMLLDKLQNDKNTDIIIALGIVSGRTAFYYKKINKPTFAPYLLKTDVTDYPRKQNLNYISVETGINEILTDFSEAVKYSRPLIIADDIFRGTGITPVTGAVKKLCAQKCEPQIIYCSVKNENLADRIPAGTDAAVITPLPRLDYVSIKKLADRFAELKIPSVYTFNTGSEDSGFMMSVRPLSYDKRARRTALNILDVLKGDKPETRPIFVDEKYESVTDLSVMRKVGVPLPFKLAEKTVLINENEDCCEKLTLHDAVKEAVGANLELIAGELGIKADKETSGELRSELFPKVTAQLQYTRMNNDNDYVKLGSYAEKSTESSVALRQLIFSEKVLARLEIQRLMHVSLREQQKILELETAKMAANAFLNVLSAKTSKNIQQTNLKLSAGNLELARGRVAAGISDMSDVYYWESEIASVRQRLLKAVSDEEKAVNALDIILNRPYDSEYAVVPATLEQLRLTQDIQKLTGMINNSQKYGKMAEFFIKKARQSSPELTALDAQIKAGARQLLSEKRADYIPDIYISGGVSRVLSEQRDKTAGIDLENDTNWQVGITASLPLFEGNAGKIRRARSGYRLAALKTKRRNAENLLRQNVLDSISSLKASYSSIALAKQSAEASRKSFLIIRNNYAEGTTPMTDLMVAQTASIEAELASAGAVYRFMSDLMELQRSLGSGSLFLEPAEHEGFTDSLISYINSRE